MSPTRKNPAKALAGHRLISERSRSTVTIRYALPVLYFACFGALLSSQSARAADHVDTLVAGPFVFERVQGKPYVEQRAFDNLLPDGDLLLIVESALPSAEDADTVSARVSLNGAEMLAPGDFNLQSQRFEVPLEAASSYMLEVEMRGIAG